MLQIFRFLILALAMALVGCASTGKTPEEERISSIPWNRPASWEGQGQFGGLMQGGR